MKPNVKSPYFYLFITFTVTIFAQAFLLGNVVRDQVLNDNTSGDLASTSIMLGLVLTGLSAVCYFKTTKKKQTVKNQILVFLLAPLVLSPVIVFIINVIVLLPLYGLVNTSSM